MPVTHQYILNDARPLYVHKGAMPGNLELCHPFCAKNPVQEWPGVGARDQVHYLSGWTVERRFTRWFDGIGCDLDIGRPGRRTSFVSLRITPVDGHRPDQT